MNGLQNILKGRNECATRLWQAAIALLLAFLLAATPGLAFATSSDSTAATDEVSNLASIESQEVSNQEANQSVLDDAFVSDTESEPVYEQVDNAEIATAEGEGSEPSEDLDPDEVFLDTVILGPSDDPNTKGYEQFYSLSDYEKACKAHDVLIEGAMDGTFGKFDPSSSSTGLKGLLPERSSSASYSEAFAYYLQKMDFKGTWLFQTGADGQTWVLVNIGGQWTHIDVAFDQGLTKTKTAPSHWCFGLTDDQVALIHSGYKNTSGHAATGLDSNYLVKTYSQTQSIEGLSSIDDIKSAISNRLGSSKNVVMPVYNIGFDQSVGSVNCKKLFYSQIAACLSGGYIGENNSIKVEIVYLPETITGNVEDEEAKGFDPLFGSYSVSTKNNVYTAFHDLLIPDETYTGNPIKPLLRTHNGLVLGEGVDFTLSYKLASTGASLSGPPTNAGTYTVTITGINNWEGSLTKTYTINPRNIAEAYIDGGYSSSVQYRGTPITQDGLILKYTSGNHTEQLNSNSYVYPFTYQDNTTGNAQGKAYIIVKGRGNFTGTKTIEFTITGAPAPTTPSDTTPNNGTGSNGATSVTTQATPTAPTVSGTWKKSSGKWWFQYDSKTAAAQKKQWPTNEWVVIGGKRYHFDSRGYMNTNWFSYSGKWYYLGSDGAMKTGWQKSGGKWYYMASDGIMQTGKKIIGNQTYYLNTSSGAMKTGWNKEGSTWYYYGSSGAMQKGWLKSGGKWYYLGANGAMQVTKQDISGKTYNFTSSGVMITGWNKESGTYYHYGSSGAMTKGWVKSGSKWYYMDPSTGAMWSKGWLDDGGKTYFLDPTNGDMLTGWNKITTTQGTQVSSNFYYFNGSGHLQKNKWVGNYYVGSDGKMATNQRIGSYWVGADGKWIPGA